MNKQKFIVRIRVLKQRIFLCMSFLCMFGGECGVEKVRKDRIKVVVGKTFTF